MNYVVGDIHGQYDRFLKLLDKLNLKETDTLYILGDIVDRGPKPMEVVDLVMKTPNFKMLLGNHEDMMCQYYATGDVTDLLIWYRNGGEVTNRAFKKLSKKQKLDILMFFCELPIEFKLEVNGRKFWLVHGGIVYPEQVKYLSDDEYRMQLIWDRIRLGDSGIKDTYVIFGHTVTSHYNSDAYPLEVWMNEEEKLIGLDCGMARLPYCEENEKDRYRLACICLENLNIIYA